MPPTKPILLLVSSPASAPATSLVLLEHDCPHVRYRDRLARRVEHRAVDEQEPCVRVARRGRAHRRLHHEPDRDDQLHALVDEELQIRLVVLLCFPGEDQRRRHLQVREGLPAQVGWERRGVLGVGERLVPARGVLEAGGHLLEAAQRAVVERLVAAAADVEREADGVRRLLFLAAAEKRENADAEEKSLHDSSLYSGWATSVSDRDSGYWGCWGWCCWGSGCSGWCCSGSGCSGSGCSGCCWG
jgi:hypothetical protein